MINFNSEKNKQILAFFFLNKQGSFSLKKLADILEIDRGNLSRYLNSLELEGVLKAKIEDRQKYFALDSAYPLLNNLKKIMAAVVNPEVLLKKSLAMIKGLKQAYLFGSYAAGNFTKNSDLDLLLVGEHDPIAVREQLMPLQRRLGREINIVDYSIDEYEKKLKDNDGFLSRISREPKIILK
ncbi:MAG: nucleotidyltransferase domain-containing protein [Patescibacteria group bacterium]|nr:nucleotidyltransferase domain-containing protein [Patescibacteria group bacterium]